MKIWSVYLLTCPDDPGTVYVGMTTDPDRRLQQHRGGRTRSTRDWIARVRAAGGDVYLAVLASGLELDQAHAAEVGEKVAQVRAGKRLAVPPDHVPAYHPPASLESLLDSAFGRVMGSLQYAEQGADRMAALGALDAGRLALCRQHIKEIQHLIGADQ